MSKRVTRPPDLPSSAGGLKPGGWWHASGERIVCDLCPRECSLKPGDRGFCFVRQNVGGEMFLTTYGRSTGFCIDPIEKKPLNHFLPGTSVLSFGTAGCNLGCKFCQNWDISKSREIERLSEQALPEDIARAARSLDCRSVAFTYNDPVIWAEYAIETARACREQGVKSVAVTAGYITSEARGPFFEVMDAANVDLKAFTEEFYRQVTLSSLQPVLDTLRWLKTETGVWFEITNLVIPDANDGTDEFRRMCDWLLQNVGDEVPVHFTAFHPDFRMTDRSRTPVETLIAARDLALAAGLKYAYIGNVHDVARQSTFCPGCGELLIERDWHQLGTYALDGDRCRRCGNRIAGVFEEQPGTWGRRRLPVDMRRFAGRGGTNVGGLPLVPLSAAPAEVSSTGQAAMPSNSNNASNRHAKPVAAVKPTVETRPSAETKTIVETQPAPASAPLTADEEQALVAAASKTVAAASAGRQLPRVENLLGDLAGRAVSGVFVSLKRRGRLRSCCGSFGRPAPLMQALVEAAQRTATHDPRFPPVSRTELPYLDLEVWLLHHPEVIEAQGEARAAAVTVGRHGVQIVAGDHRGLLLPGVAVERRWNSREFLSQVCIKAGLPASAWKDDATTLHRFRGEAVRGRISQADWSASPPVLYRPEQVAAYGRYCRNTILTLSEGGTPIYYCLEVSDADVHGAVVTAAHLESGRQLMMSRLSLQTKIPLQATLFSLCEQTAVRLQQEGLRPDQIRALQFGVTILHDPALHGTVAKPDLAGLDPAQRIVLVSEKGNVGWIFDSEQSVEELLDEAVRLAESKEPAHAQIFSLAYHSTEARGGLAAVRRPVGGPAERPPAVAGRFYPADPDELSRMLDELLAGEADAAPCAAALVPHAGWTYSGRIAAGVLKRIAFPSQVIVLGPKHTPHGMEWSVAPHRSWLYPGGRMESDPQLARELAEEIPGLHLDAAAHSQEHAIEVEIPLLARLAPHSRVVGIAIGGGNLKRCRRFAEGLARVLKRREERPLLLISSDMNHFASDAATRELDALALAELERLDPESLYRTVTGNHISMCGVLPAVIVLETLRQLGAVSQCRRIAYATSGDVTGDRGRVVGYAGLLFE